MNHLKNEDGNATFYMIWLLGIVALIFLIVLNLVKVYVVKEHANLSAEQAAIAGTATLLTYTERAVDEVDDHPVMTAERVATGKKKLSKLVKDKQQNYIDYQNMDDSTAYIKAINEVIPAKMNENPMLEHLIRNKFRGELGHSIWDLQMRVGPSIQDVIAKNGGNTTNTEILLSTSKWRLEVKSTVTFKSISDHKFITNFVGDIPEKGYGPRLEFLKHIY
jgi:hypothetical protein